MRILNALFLLLCLAASCLAAGVRTVPGTNLIVLLPDELAANETARCTPYIALQGKIYDVSRIWASLNAANRFVPGTDITAEAARTKEADSIRRQPLVGFVAARAFSAAELAKCNGRNGAPKYIAYDGIVFDFSPVQWGNRHHPFSALGRDNTEVFIRSCGECHGPDVFTPYAVVGVLVKK